jgi:hypothetical protein
MGRVLAWERSRGGLDAAVLALRAAARGAEVRLSRTGFHFPDELGALADDLGMTTARSAAADGHRLFPPRIALFAGMAIGYPYYAYYAHCLLSLGLSYRQAGAADIARGALDDVDLLIIPGGFATWGLDRAEGREGLDAAVRAFVTRGGAVIGSYGGLFYLSQGRPGWLGLIDAKPKYTHEYLQTGAGVVNVRLLDQHLSTGLPEVVEMPYYHGPAYRSAPRRAQTLATFDSLALPSRLFIDNPLERTVFEQDLENRPAILAAAPDRGRALGFSAHPEMGDFVRKGIALDGYVRKYLPIRGEKVLDETLRFYASEDTLSFLLVFNAIDRLGLFATAPLTPSVEPDGAMPDRLDASLRALEPAHEAAARAYRERLATEPPALARLIEAEIHRLSRERTEHVETIRRLLRRMPEGLGGSLDALLADAARSLPSLAPMPLAQALVMLELPVRVLAAAARMIRCDAALGELCDRVLI